MKKILLVGGTGFIGQALGGHLRKSGYEVLILGRNARSSPESVMLDDEGLIPNEVLAGLAGIINLAGETIGQRWTAVVKDKILSSRIESTQRIVASLERGKENGIAIPSVLLNASAIGFYGAQPSGLQTEDSPKGAGFLASVCQAWEKEAQVAERLGVRVVIFRFGIVLGLHGGILAKMSKPCKLGVGGVIGSGRQHVSWIHYKDVARAVSFALESEKLKGPYNLTAPQVVTMNFFMNALAKQFGKPSWTKLPSFVARVVLGDMANEVLLADQDVFPKRLLEEKFVFQFTELLSCLDDIYQPTKMN